jgi:hypothetical protein
MSSLRLRPLFSTQKLTYLRSIPKVRPVIARFPGRRKSGPGWITPRMWEERTIEALQRFGAQQEASRAPTPLEDLLLRAQARLAELRFALTARSLK